MEPLRRGQYSSIMCLMVPENHQLDITLNYTEDMFNRGVSYLRVSMPS